ncbi:MAG: metalloregulator ArsR/SmtB family transcription factor [Candidatus Bathyarchaeota archaeon]
MSDRNEKMKELQDEMRLLKDQLLRISERLEETAEEEPTQSEAPSVEAEPEEAPQSAETHDDDEEVDAEEDVGGYYYGPRYRRYRRPPRPPAPQWGDRLGDYISEFVDDVMEGVTSELERSLFTEQGDRGERPTVLTDSEVTRTAAVMNAMANEHRIKILKELTWGGMYAGDFQERLKEISPSTLSSHLDTLQDAGLVIQERRRGRYLITMNGRIAIKMAATIAKRADMRVEPEDLD